MNTNKLFKMLKRAENSFNNLDAYKKILEGSSRVVVDFTNFTGLEAFTTRAVELAKSQGLSLPVDNIILDVSGITVSDPITGKPAKQSLMLHTVPVEVATDISTFHLMLVQDMRQVKKDVFPRSHVVFLNKDLSIMPAVDIGMPEMGCKCFQRNPFSHKPLFQKIQSFTPGFKADCGFALGGCKSELKCCKFVQNGSKEVVHAAIAAIIFAALPGHVIVKVTDKGQREQDGLKQMPYFVVCDPTSLKTLKDTGKLTPLQFNNYTQLASLPNDVFDAPSTFSFGSVDYEVIAKPVMDESENLAKMRV
jgi:hypothetical protein